VLKRIIKKILIIFSAIVVLFLALALVITIIYGDNIKQYFISKINNYLNTEVKVGDVQFSLLSKFPDACITFNDVVAMSAKGFEKTNFKNFNSDTLLVAKKVFLQFNIFDIFSKKYNIKAIQIENGYSNILIDYKGGDNYHFWKAVESSDSSDFKLDLKNIQLNEFNLLFYNKSQELKFKCYTSDFNISGKFNNDKYELKTSGDIELKKFIINKVSYIKNNALSIKLKFDVDNNNFKIKKGTISISDVVLNVTGNYNFTSSNINLKIFGNNIDIVNFISILPQDIQKKLSDFTTNGIMYFNSVVKGKIDYKNTPNIFADFGIKKSTIKQESTDVKLENVFVKGSFTNGKKQSTQTSILKLDSVYAVINNNIISGSYSISNFSNPSIKLNVNGNFELEQLSKFLNLKQFKNVNGKAKANIVFSGNVENLTSITASDYKNSVSSGKIILTNTNLQFVNSTDLYSNINAGFTFHNNDVRIDSLKFLLNGHDFEVSGYLKNLIAYLMLDNEKLNIETSIHSKYLDVKQMFVGDNNKTGGVLIPENVTLSSNIFVDELNYGKFNAKRASAFIECGNNAFTFTSLVLESFGGNINADGAVKITNNKIKLQTNAKFKNINIKSLFYSFDNFGQTFILDKNMKGILNADLSVSADWDNNFTLNQNSLTATCTAQINNGELINFEPMYKLSDYIAVSELKQIKFDKLTNDIVIKDRKVIIPQMEIKSSAFNIELSGEHTFDNNIDYKLKVLLSEILANKAKKAKKENEEFGVVEDDGLGRTSLYLSIKGNVENYKITYDTKKVKEHIKDNLKQEKETLKTILNEEFGWFKNDSTIAKKKQKNEEIKKPQFMIKWDEDQPEIDKSE